MFAVTVATDAGGCGGSLEIAVSDEVRPSVDDDMRWRAGAHRCEYVRIAVPAGDICRGRWRVVV